MAPWPALVAAFLGGVVLAAWLPILPPPWLCALPLLAWPWLGRLRWPVLLFVLAATMTVWRAELRLAERWPPARHGEDIALSGIVDSLPERSGPNWRFVFAPDDRTLPPRLRTSWYRSDEALQAGQCWRFTLRMRTPRGSLNPGTFDYERWLFVERHGATAYVREAERCPEGDRPHGIDSWRQRMLRWLDAQLPGHSGLPLLKALLVGDRSGLDDRDWRALRLTGTSHLVAISGLHIALVAGFAFGLVRWGWCVWPRLCLWWPAQRVGACAALMAACVYAGLAGFAIPTLRALLMLAAFLLAGLAARKISVPLALGLAAALILALDPFSALSPGFWMSFGAVAAIVYAVGGRRQAPPKWLAFLRLQAALGLLLVPASLAFFEGASLASPLVNLLAVPLFALLLPVLLSVTVLAAIGWLAPLAAGAGLLAMLHRGLLALAELLPQGWLGLAPGAPALLLASLGIVLLTAPRGVPLKPAGALLCLPLLWPVPQAPRQGFHLTALDVGQGLSVVVRTAGHTLLYDAGPAYAGGFDAGETVVLPYLRHVGVRQLDRLILSHGDSDHAGGIAAVRAGLPVRQERGLETPCRAGERWEWDGVRFEILHPDERHWSDNNRSCVLLIEAPQGRALLAGDIETEAELSLLARRREALAADVLLAPHHGSRSSSSRVFVDAVRPRWVIYAAGWRHHYGHPHEQVDARYADIGAQRLSTGVSGAVRVRFGDTIEVEAWRRRHRRYWNLDAEP